MILPLLIHIDLWIGSAGEVEEAEPGPAQGADRVDRSRLHIVLADEALQRRDHLISGGQDDEETLTNRTEIDCMHWKTRCIGRLGNKSCALAHGADAASRAAAGAQAGAVSQYTSPVPT